MFRTSKFRTRSLHYITNSPCDKCGHRWLISYDEGESEVTSDEENNVEAGPCQFKPMPWRNSHLQEEIAQRSKQKRTTKVEIA